LQIFFFAKNMSEQKTPDQLFLEACEKGQFSDVQQLLSKNKNLLNISDADGWTGLMYATTYEHTNIVEYLLQNGANPNITLKNSKRCIFDFEEEDFNF